MQYQVVEVGKFRQTPADTYMSKTQAFCMIFVIAPEGNFILKGMDKECGTYLKQHFVRYIARYTYWHKGKHRGSWFGSRGLSVRSNTDSYGNRPKRLKYKVVIMPQGKPQISIEFRHLPKHWLPAYNEAF